MKKLYFIAWVIGGEEGQAITAIKETVCAATGCCHALKSPPHVTVIPPFWMEPHRISKLRRIVEEWAGSYPPFVWSLDGFSHFDERVVFIAPFADAPLEEMQRALVQRLQGNPLRLKLRTRKHFHPHVSVAVRIPDADTYQLCWQLVNRMHFSCQYPQLDVAILQYNGKKWDIVATAAHHDG